MIVQTAEQFYAVVRVLWDTETEEVSVCRDASNNLCTLVCFKDAEKRGFFLPLLARQRDNPAFSDYLGVFTQNGALYARFRYTDAPTLAQRLEKDNWSLRERLEIGSSLLEQITLMNMPPAILFQALQERNVTVDDSLTVRFNYTLKNMDNCEKMDMAFVCAGVQRILERLFQKELTERSVPELVEFFTTLDHNDFTAYLELYSMYDQVRRALLSREIAGQVEPQTWLFRLWAKIKSLRRFVRPVLGGIVLIAALCYLIYTLLAPTVPKGELTQFGSIGTVEIQSAASQDAAAGSAP